MFEMFLNSAQNSVYVRGGGVLKGQIKPKNKNSTVKTTMDSKMCPTNTISFSPFFSKQFLQNLYSLFTGVLQTVNKQTDQKCYKSYFCRIRAYCNSADSEAEVFYVEDNPVSRIPCLSHLFLLK
jgi:hypothetical protein